MLDCEGSWLDWTPCTDGVTRRRFHQPPGRGGHEWAGGKPCLHANNTELIENCGTACLGHWKRGSEGESWGPCNEGKRRRTFHISSPAKDGGKNCPVTNSSMQIESCTGTDCVGGWGEWSGCSSGQMARIFKHSVTQKDGGKKCAFEETKFESKECGIGLFGIGFCPPSLSPLGTTHSVSISLLSKCYVKNPSHDGNCNSTESRTPQKSRLS